MKEHTRKVVDVLGIDVSLIRPDKAVNITMNYITSREMRTIFFHTAESSLYCESQDWAARCVDSCHLVLPGDIYMEHALVHTAFEGEGPSGNSRFAEEYIHRLLGRLEREGREVFVVTAREEDVASLKDDMKEVYPHITLDVGVLKEDTEVDIEALINEINGTIPDIVFLCLPAKTQCNLLREYISMINTHLVVFMGSMRPSVLMGTETVPKWVEDLHLTGLYQWFHKEDKLQGRIIGSIFKRTVQEKK